MTRRGPGEGSIYQRKDGRWAGSVHLGYEGGKRIRKHVLGHSRAEVKDKLDALVRANYKDRFGATVGYLTGLPYSARS